MQDKYFSDVNVSLPAVIDRGKTPAAVQSYQIGVIILSVIVLIETGLLVRALVKIFLISKKGERHRIVESTRNA